MIIIIFHLLILLLLCNIISSNNGHRTKRLNQDEKDMLEFQLLRSLQPINYNNSKISYVMFWRPQKVGSSTVLSILTSYGYRFNKLSRRKGNMNSLCKKISQCFIQSYDEAKSGYIYKTLYNDFQVTNSMYNYLKSYSIGQAEGAGPPKIAGRKQDLEVVAEQFPYHMSVQHNLCNLNSRIIQEELLCSFNHNKNIINYNIIPEVEMKQIFVLRNPLDRMISVYYFWGELFKLAAVRNMGPSFGNKARAKKDINNNNNLELPKKNRLGAYHSGPVDGNLFSYHGNETTVPPMEFAYPFAQRLPLAKGMPGPSLTWSGFSNNKKDAMRIIESDYMMTIISERLDESLVVASKFLGWSLADVVVTIYRKALSKHPKAKEWPKKAIDHILLKLEENGEIQLYEAANKRLNERIADLRASGVDFDKDVQLLKDLRKRASEICHTDLYLEVYKKKLIKEGYHTHFSDNRLRDAEDRFFDDGHAFSFNRDILYSFDVCGNCEAHAFLLGYNLGLASSINEAPSLQTLDPKYTQNNVNFMKCPTRDMFQDVENT